MLLDLSFREVFLCDRMVFILIFRFWDDNLKVEVLNDIWNRYLKCNVLWTLMWENYRRDWQMLLDLSPMEVFLCDRMFFKSISPFGVAIFTLQTNLHEPFLQISHDLRISLQNPDQVVLRVRARFCAFLGVVRAIWTHSEINFKKRP